MFNTSLDTLQAISETVFPSIVVDEAEIVHLVCLNTEHCLHHPP